MSKVFELFNRIENLTKYIGINCDYKSVWKHALMNENPVLSNETLLSAISFIYEIFGAIDLLATEIENDSNILISVKHQKSLRTCFQLTVSIGISPCLIPGLGLDMTKRSDPVYNIPPSIKDNEKYEILMNCTDFFTKCYSIPVLKNIIITFHLSDYLACLIQLAFAPFQKPGTYRNFVMTQQMYDQLNVDRLKYVDVYNHLTTNCFQPTLMKELLVLQSPKDPEPPVFVKKVIAKELSQRLLAPGGLLSLIRCFIEIYDIDTGFGWKKIDMICRIVASKHGKSSQNDYLFNICAQLKQTLSLNNGHYLPTVVACVLSLNKKYPNYEPVGCLVKGIFQVFDYEDFVNNYSLPGTIILTPQEVQHKLNVLHACVCTRRLHWPMAVLIPNLYLIFLIGVKCTKNDDLKIKIKDIILNCLEKLTREQLRETVKSFLFGKNNAGSRGILVEEYDAGIAIKSVASLDVYSYDYALSYFLKLFRATTNEDELVLNIFQVALDIVMDLSTKRQKRGNKDMLLNEGNPELMIDDIDQQYAAILQLLSEISSSAKTTNLLKKNPLIVTDFIQHFIIEENSEANSECVSVALVLLTTILSSSNSSTDLERQFSKMIPIMKRKIETDKSVNSILYREALSLITSGNPQKYDTPYSQAMPYLFNEREDLRGHGMIRLTNLIERNDPETISKKYYIFCAFQEQLKDPDSYVYLSAIKGLAALGTHCTEDVLHLLCKEFLQTSRQENIQTADDIQKVTKLRLKIGDVIVKVTKGLGEMAIVHKATLLNTMLCGCRDDDPLIRTSALSNLAEIALVLHYKIGHIINEVLLCTVAIIESDEAVECRRAAVMVITSLIKGLGRETLVELKEDLLPIYRLLKHIYKKEDEDSVVKLHAQLALEELNAVVDQFMFPELKHEKQIFVLDQP